MTGEIAHKGKIPLQAGKRWPVERTNAWHNNFNRLQRCYERREDVIDAFFDLAEAIITVRSLIREAWTLYRWDGRPPGWPLAYPGGRRRRALGPYRRGATALGRRVLPGVKAKW